MEEILKKSKEAIAKNQDKFISTMLLIDEILTTKIPNKFGKTVDYSNDLITCIKFSFQKYDPFAKNDEIPTLPIKIIIDNTFISGFEREKGKEDKHIEFYEPTVSIPALNLIFPIKDMDLIRKYIETTIDMMKLPKIYDVITKNHYKRNNLID